MWGVQFPYFIFKTYQAKQTLRIQWKSVSSEKPATYEKINSAVTNFVAQEYKKK